MSNASASSLLRPVSAGRGKRFDVAQDGARGDLELFGQGIRGQLAALTQQQDQGHQPVSSHDEDVI